MENHNRKIKQTWLCATALFLIMSCHNQTENSNINATIQQAGDTAKVISISNGKHCFAYTENNDSVFLFLIIQKNSAKGKLIYHLNEKDKNTGTINGRFRGDTLFASYSFLSEGQQSVRQVIFLKKGNVFQEGNGSMREVNGEIVFSNPKEVSFTGNIILFPVDCNGFGEK